LSQASRPLTAGPTTLNALLEDEVQLYCPLFQRKYVWTKGPIDQLWRDIDTITDGTYERRFLGALVFDDEGVATTTRAGRYWIIDGQQRLTTLVLTVIALAAHAQHYGDAGRVIGQDLVSQYIVCRKSENRYEPKLRPTLADTRQFNGVLQSLGDNFKIELNFDQDTGEADGTLFGAYRLILKHVEKRTSSNEDGTVVDDTTVVARIEALRNVILEGLEFVAIRLGDIHDPNEVFDRLNKDGMKLGIIDLVRNEVLKRLGDNARTGTKEYHTQWKPFEDAFKDDAARAGYFFPFALTVDPTTTTARAFSALTTRWATLVKSDPPLTPEAELSVVMKDLRSHQAAYNSIASGEYSSAPPQIREKVRRLHALGSPTVIYPYVMQLITAVANQSVTADAANACLAIIESFLVRRAIAGLEPTGLHAVFKKLWGAAKADPNLLRSEIVSTTIAFPDDERFRAGISEGNLYTRNIKNYVLEEYERSFTDGDVLSTFPTITVDHVLPQSRDGDWALIFSDEEFDRWINTWANLVPLSSQANSSKGSKSWAEAKAKLSNETVFSSTKHIYDDYVEWNPAALEARLLVLQKWAVERWPSFQPK
jgi:hypothetical protein